MCQLTHVVALQVSADTCSGATCVARHPTFTLFAVFLDACMCQLTHVVPLHVSADTCSSTTCVG